MTEANAFLGFDLVNKLNTVREVKLDLNATISYITLNLSNGMQLKLSDSVVSWRGGFEITIPNQNFDKQLKMLINTIDATISELEKQLSEL